MPLHHKFFLREKEVRNLSETELNALENLTKNKDLVIQKADKASTVDIINKTSNFETSNWWE